MAEAGEKQSKLVSVMETFGNLFALNLLFVLCSLPVITFGASLTALYSMTLKMVRKEEDGIWKGFFTAFKTNFKKATVLWLMLLIAIVIIAGEVIFSFSFQGVISYVYLVLAAVEVIGLAFVLPFLFPLCARYDNTLGNTIKNSLLLSIGNIGSWLKITLIWFMPCFLMIYYFEVLFLSIWYLWLLFIPALLAFCASIILRKVFEKVSRTQEQNRIDEEEKVKKEEEEKEARRSKILDKMKRFENPEESE